MEEPQPNPRWRIAGLITMALGLWALLTVLALTVGPRVFSPRATAASPGAPGSAAEIPRVSLADAKNALEAGSAVFVDVRDPASYAAGHIPGARSLPLDVLEQAAGELDPQAWIITYCT